MSSTILQQLDAFNPLNAGVDAAVLVPWTVVLVAAAVGAALDLKRHTLPNALTVPLFVSGLVFAAAAGGLGALGGSLAAAIILAIPYVVLFALAKGGAGDAKMMAGVGAWLGLANAPAVLLAVALAGGVAAIGLAVARGQLARVAANAKQAANAVATVGSGRLALSTLPELMPQASSMHRFPYGAAIAVGAAIAFLGVQPWHA